MEGPAESINATCVAGSFEQLFGSEDVQASTVSWRKPHGGVAAQASGGESVQATGGLDGDTRCPVPSLGPTLTASVCMGSSPTCTHCCDPSRVHGLLPVVEIDSMRR